MPTDTPHRILIVQLADIGDLVLSTPAISALREHFPQAHIALLANAHAAPVIQNTELVDEVIPFERVGGNNSRAFFAAPNRQRLLALRRARYDTVIFLHHFTLKWGTLKFALIALLTGARRRVGLDNGRGWFLTHRLPDAGFGAQHQAQYWLNLVGLLGASASPRPAQVTHAPYELPSVPHGVKRVVIHAGSGGYSLARRWSAENFAAVGDTLAQDTPAQIILVGSAGDDADAVQALMQAPAINLSGKTSLAQLNGVIQQADVFIGADSGVLHIASASGVPVVSIFGSSNDQAWGAWSPAGQVALMRSYPVCAPCSYVEHGIGLRNGCTARTCLKMVTPQAVIDTARALLNGQTPPVISTPRQPYRHPRRIQLLGLPVDVITYEEWFTLIHTWITAPHRTARQVCTTNPEFIMMAQSDVNFRHILTRVDLCVPDGVGLLIGARLTGQTLTHRITGSDGVPLIAERSAREGWRVFLLGAGEGIAQQAADALTTRYPDLQIAGVHGGSPAPEEEDALIARINAARADILFVAYGAPNQDKWIARNLPRLNVGMAMGVGGTFDFIAGKVPRAPQIMRRYGLEWLYRLYLEPSRIGRMTRLPRFLWSVIRYGQRGTW